MRIYFLNFAECPRCTGCAHYKRLTSQYKHSPKVCYYALDTGHCRGEPVQHCTKNTAVAVATAQWRDYIW